MRLDYYFWNNIKKQGYNDGLVFRPLYKKLIQDGDHKKIDELVNTRTQEILKNQKNQTEKTIESLEYNILSYQKSIDILDDKKNKEVTAIQTQYESDILKNKENYKIYKDGDLDMIKNINKKLLSFYESIDTYTKEAKENIKTNINNLLDYCQNMQNNIQGAFSKNAENDLEQNLHAYVNIDNKNRINHMKDIMLVSFLLFLFIFDSYLGHKAVKDFLIGTDKGLLLEIGSWFLAIGFAILVIGLTHLLLKEINKTKGMEKNIYMLVMVILLLIIGIYIWLSSPLIPLEQLLNPLVNKSIMETIMRALLIPSLVGGEIVLSKINRDNIFLYGKKLNQPFRFINSLILKQIYAIKKRKINITLLHEQKQINNILENISSNINNNIAFSYILDTVNNIKTLLGPIYDNHASKVEEFENKARALEHQRSQSIDQIEQKYIEQINIEDNKILSLQNKITEIKRQLGDAENEVGAGLKIGLTS